jgi:hypothetical protein
VTAQADQSHEHDKEQDDIGGESGESIKFVVLSVNHEAVSVRGKPLSANLQMNEPGISEAAETGQSPSRHLQQNEICMSLDRQGEERGRTCLGTLIQRWSPMYQLQ